MPLRMVVILSGLFAFCLAVPVFAWIVGSEFYLFVPHVRHGFEPSVRPPTEPFGPLFLLIVCASLWFYLPRYGLGFLAVLTGSLFLGTIIGWGVFEWTPTISQHILSIGLIGLLGYSWSILKFVE